MALGLAIGGPASYPVLAVGAGWALAYEVVHRLSHSEAPPDGWLGWLVRHHQLHHRCPDRNYNVVLPLADRTLGTLGLRRTRGRR